MIIEDDAEGVTVSIEIIGGKESDELRTILQWLLVIAHAANKIPANRLREIENKLRPVTGYFVDQSLGVEKN